MGNVKITIAENYQWRISSKKSFSEKEVVFARRLLAEHVEWFGTKAFPTLNFTVELGSTETIACENVPNDIIGTVHSVMQAALNVQFNLVVRIIKAKRRQPIYRVLQYVWSAGRVKKPQLVHLRDEKGKILCGRKIKAPAESWLHPKGKEYCKSCKLRAKNEDPFFWFPTLSTPSMKRT